MTRLWTGVVASVGGIVGLVVGGVVGEAAGHTAAGGLVGVALGAGVAGGLAASKPLGPYVAKAGSQAQLTAAQTAIIATAATGQ